MSLESVKVRVPLWLILILGILSAITIFGYWYYRIDSSNSKLVGIVGGIVTGLIVYLATFLTLLRPIQELDRFRQMGVKDLLANRHDQAYYRKLVSGSTFRVDVMGASCGRFVRDFLDVDSDDKVLIDALNKNSSLTIHLLVPDAAHMGAEANARNVTTLEQVARVRERFGDRVELRRFADTVRHSFVIADNDLVAGPVFENDKSRHAPAVHVGLDTSFGQKYAAYFDATWKSAEAIA